MKAKIIGLILTAAGFFLLIVSLGLWKLDVPVLDNFLKTFKPIYITIAGLILAIIGAFLAFGNSRKSSGRARQESEEVPIYEGAGKKRTIVGYRREK